MRDPTLQELGWFAGLLDSKGRIVILRLRDAFQLRVTISGPPPILKKCETLFGGTRDCAHTWTIEGREAKTMLCRVQASLAEKREHAAAALLFPVGKSPKARAIQEVCYRTLKQLNKGLDNPVRAMLR